MSKFLKIVKCLIEKDLSKKIEGLIIVSKDDIDNGISYHLRIGDYDFFCILQDFGVLKMTFCFHEAFTMEEKSFWEPKYKFRMFMDHDKTYTHLVGILKIRDVMTNNPVKVIMNRDVESLPIIIRDFHKIAIMVKGRAAEVIHSE